DNAAAVFNMARTDVAGFEEYATKIARMFDEAHDTLFDLMEGLFVIAVADGDYHPAEDDYLARVAKIFGMTDREFKALRAQFVPDAEPDPWDVLGVDPDTPMEQIRAAWRQAVRDSHPDQMIARGVPEEAIKLAEKRMVAINRAWEVISAGKV
ncbi:MAG: TerB family tellurite resistance protein, partial [Erythrobacter sp.]